MNAIVSAASGRSVSSSTISASGVTAGGGSAVGVVGEPAARRAEGDDPPPGRRVLLEAALQRHRQGERAPGHRARRARRARRSRRRPRVSPLHFHSEEKGTSARTRSPVAG